ncbi:MAG: glycosyltransferase [Lentimicrobiaceae bacterium]|nr:glycosyltransferase [Lentimicrobiaceae bacterium]
MKLTPVKVLFLIHSLEEGGAERVLTNLLKMFDHSRFEVHLCVVENRGIYFKEVPPQVKIIRLFDQILLSRVLIKLHVKFNMNWYLRLVVNLKIRETYDVGISFLDSAYTDFLFFLGKKIKRKIAWVHSSYKTYSNFGRFYRGAYKKRITRNRYGKLDEIVFVSNDSRKEFEEIFGRMRSTRVILNLLNINEIINLATISPPVKFNTKVANIVAVGVLLPVKGYDKLIHAAQLLKDENLKFKIRILGNGYLEESLSMLIHDLGLENEVELCGYQQNPYTYMQHSDIFVMTSISEGWPTALCEAFILELPVVVTDCSGCRELVANGEYGIMVQQSAVAIAEGLKQLIIKPEKLEYYKQRAAARKLIFNDEIILNQVYELIEGKSGKP